MVGFFKAWSVSGTTTKAAQNSGEQYRAGLCSTNIDEYKREIDQHTKNAVSAEVRKILSTNIDFEEYILRGNKKKHDAAVEFLVMIAAVMYGAEERGWDWKEIRNFSQGLYGSMIDTPQTFKSQNLPVIEDVIARIKLLL